MTLTNGTVLIRGARQLLTLRGSKEPRRGYGLGELGVIYDGSVLIRDGVLEEVGPTRRVENLALAKGATEIDATGKVVMPGLIDAHSHLLFPFAAHSDDDESDASDVHAITGKRLESRARGYVDAMVRHGTTTLEVKTGCGLDESAESKLLRVLGALDGDPLDIVPTFLVRLDDYAAHSPAAARERIEWLCQDLMPKIWRRKQARFADIYWTGDPVTQSAAMEFIETTHQLGFSLKVHNEVDCTPSGARLAVESGAITVDHVECAGADDLELLAASGTIATLLPAAAFHDRDRCYAPGRELVNAGIAVALGSNFNPLLTPSLSMQTTIALAAAHMRLTPEEAIAAATINAAHALRCADKLGSLEFGKAADLLILDTGDYRDLAHHFGHNLVATTIKHGRIISTVNSVDRRPGPALERAG